MSNEEIILLRNVKGLEENQKIFLDYILDLLYFPPNTDNLEDHLLSTIDNLDIPKEVISIISSANLSELVEEIIARVKFEVETKISNIDFAKFENNLYTACLLISMKRMGDLSPMPNSLKTLTAELILLSGLLSRDKI